MAKKADAGWTSKNKMPGYIPPYKAPRPRRGEQTNETNVQPVVIDCSESLQKDSDSEEGTQFGVVWEKLKDVEAKESEAETPKQTEIPTPIEYVGDIWRDKTRPIVLITETKETERPTSDTEEDNIPVIQTLVRKEKEIPTGEMCVGKTVLKQFDEGLLKSNQRLYLPALLALLSATGLRCFMIFHLVTIQECVVPIVS
jgi:hypothetical protein